MKFVFLPAMILIAGTMLAQQPSLELNPVTVSASLQPLPVSKTGRNIISIPGERFQQLPVHSVDELLRYVPGIEVQMRGPQGSQSDIVLRGGTFQQVLIVLDGVRLNDPNTGHFNSYIPIAPAEIERIEVLKGASSAVYGSDAVGGVINIITRSFAARNSQQIKELNAAMLAGEYGLYNANLGGIIQKKRTSISGGLLTNNSNGQPQRGARGFFHNHSASLSLKHFLKDNLSIALRGSFDRREFGAQNFYTTFASDTADEKVDSWWTQARISLQKGKHRLNLDAGFKAVKDIFRFNPSSLANNNRSKLLQFLLTDHYQLGKDAVLTGGLQFQQRNIRSNDRGQHSLSQMAAFVIYHQSIGNLAISPSLRFDHNEGGRSELIPQLNLSYAQGKWQFRGSAGRTIRDADFTERYNNYNKSLVTGGSVGNPWLVAESSFSYEIGVDYFATTNLKLSLTGFERRQRELIDWVTTPYNEMPRKENLSPAGTFALAKNIARVNTAGLEMDIQYSRDLGKGQQLYSTAGLLWLDSQSGSGEPSFYLSSHANFLANFNLMYSNNAFSVSVNGIYKNRDPQNASGIGAKINSDYFVLNAMASLFLAKKRLSLFAEVDNIFDVSYSDLLGSRMPGRWVMGGVRVRVGE